MIYIKESGLTFGPFSSDELLQIEDFPPINKANHVKLCEFVWWNSRKKQLVLVEAKRSIPAARTAPDSYEAFWSAIHEKFDNALQVVLLSGHDRPKGTNNELPVAFRSLPWPTLSIVLYLVVPNAPDAYLAQLTERLSQEMRTKKRLWKAEMFVINTQKAAKKGLI